MRRLTSFLLLFFFCLTLTAQEPSEDLTIHPEIGTMAWSEDSTIRITLVGKKQNYSASDTIYRDRDVWSPKSVHVHPRGHKYYVNSLEGSKTVVYGTKSNRKMKVIRHQFDESDSLLWSEPSGFFEFTHYEKNLNSFKGKPVESAFSHGGRYLWVPYYRRSFDINAQDPSAVAVIDTETDSIVRLMETGPLPKMIAVSDDNRYVAITHWGDNTVGIIDITGDSLQDWHYVACVTVKKKLSLDFPLDSVVNRDVNSGLCLRGTAFTPDNRYLLVGCMGGKGGIAVIDLNDFSYQGIVSGMRSNLRHLVVNNGYIYLSINMKGYIQRIPLDLFLASLEKMEKGKVVLEDWEECKVGAGARTIALTPDGRFIVAACNFSSCLYVVHAETMEVVTKIPADSYPVGLDISKDGGYVFTTSQGRDKHGGNCVDIFKIDYSKESTLQ